jgi:pimeloyl-ACP methyl ester carboxylesterase
MAERLSRGGFHVMRFDYYATGDSSGDCHEGTLERWIDDVMIASDELTDSAGVQDVAWVGLRFGGTIAALASAQRVQPKALVLWDPVVDGLAYLEELRRAHLALLEEDLEFPPPHPFSSGTAHSVEVDQALGFPIPPALHREIRTLNASRVAQLKARWLAVVADPGTPTLDDLREALHSHSGQVVWTPLTSSERWNSEQALNSTVVPVGAVNAVIRLLEELR